MKSVICAVRDVKLNEFNPPVVFQSVGQAERVFHDEALPGKDSMLSKHPEDFSLYLVGTFDGETGEFEACSPPVFITQAA